MAVTKTKKPLGNSKRMRASHEHAVKAALPMQEAIAALRKFKATKFDQTVNVCFHLGIDPKAADQALRGSIALPHGIGKSARVIAFCGADKVAAAKAAGAV
ncbi:MAG: 50S ribosomal protein L1, partial [Phycisphaerales bacterium]